MRDFAEDNNSLCIGVEFDILYVGQVCACVCLVGKNKAVSQFRGSINSVDIAIKRKSGSGIFVAKERAALFSSLSLSLFESINFKEKRKKGWNIVSPILFSCMSDIAEWYSHTN